MDSLTVALIGEVFVDRDGEARLRRAGARTRKRPS